MKKKSKQSAYQVGLSTTKIIIIIVAVILAVVAAVVLYSTFNQSSQPTPPAEPFDESRQVIDKDPQSASPSQSSTQPQ